MKIAFSVIIFFLSLNVYSQTYYQFPKNNSVWIDVEYGDGTLPAQREIVSCSQFGLFGDTIINGLNYSKLYQAYGSVQANFNIQMANYVGAVREDANKKVWLIYPSASAEILKYDFGLNLGDNFCFENQPSTPGVLCLPVSLVDSILINGNYRRQIHFTYDGQTDIWIEGIGSIVDNWIGAWSYYGNIEWNLNCFYQNNVNVYGNCDYPTGINDIVNEPVSIKIFPNPVNSELCLELPNICGPFEGNIYSSTGEKVISFYPPSGASKMDITQLKAGIYFIFISDKQGKLWTNKIIKNQH